MDKKTIGILGGMGPLATCDLFEKIVTHTQATCDQEHLHVLVDCDPSIPDRTAALLCGGEDPVPALLRSARRLETAGAELLVIPCNTSHNFYDTVSAAVSIPVLHMISLTRDAMVAQKITRAGLLATDGTVQTGIYQRTFANSGIDLLVPEGEDQKAVMELIYQGVKAGNAAFPTDRFCRTAEGLLARGAQALILGCTELPAAFAMYHLNYPAVDPTLELALGAIRAAGGTVKEEKTEVAL